MQNFLKKLHANKIRTNTKAKICALLLIALKIFGLNPLVKAEDKIEVDTITIRGNQELPKILYIIPWQKGSLTESQEGQKLMLHSLYGDLFDPMLPQDSPGQDSTNGKSEF